MSDEHEGFMPPEGSEPDEDTEAVPRDVWSPPPGSSGAVRIIPPDPGKEPPVKFGKDDTGPMPHWTDPPTGEVPRIFGDQTRPDDLDDWAGLGSEQPVWRDDRERLGGFEDVPDLGDRSPMGALGDQRGDPADPFFDDDFDEAGDDVGPAAVTPISTRSARPRINPPRAATARRNGGTSGEFTPTRGTGGRDMPLAIGVGVALVALFLVLLAAGPRYAVALVVAVLIAAAIEFFDGLRRVGYQPATLLGLAAVAGLPLAAYWRYESGVLLVLTLSLAATLGWYVVADQDVKAVPNIAVTFLGIGYIGLLGSFAALMLAIPVAGTGLLFGVAACTVAYDIGGLFVGSGLGRSPIAPEISPNKTVEGLIGGAMASILVGIVLSQTMNPWDEKLVHGLQLGIVVALAAPLGDLVESRMKRDLGLKDFGTLLPGHGGVLDRFDAFLFTLPAVYYLVRILNLFGQY